MIYLVKLWCYVYVSLPEGMPNYCAAHVFKFLFDRPKLPLSISAETCENKGHKGFDAYLVPPILWI